MSFITKLLGFGVRQVIEIGAGDGHDSATRAAGSIIDLVGKHFTDHSQTLPRALARANDRAWQALGIALAGEGFLDQIRVFFASADDRGIREQVRLFLQGQNSGFEGSSPEFRKACLAELQRARQAGLLSVHGLSAGEIGQQAATFQRHANLQGLVDAAERVSAQMAEELGADFPSLAQLLRQRPTAGPPLLVAAFAYFFRREVETDDELAHGLFFDSLRQLSASQARAFGEVSRALTTLGEQFEQVFAGLDRIEAVAVATQAVAVATQGAVLDMQVELQRLNGLQLANSDEVRRLMQEVLQRVSQAGMHRGEVKPHDSFGIRSEEERQAARQLLARFRQLPRQQQQLVPALLNGLGKLQFGSGDFEEARQTFEEVARSATQNTAQAESQFNVYRAALEVKDWSKALTAILQAAALDPQRFAPFPLQRYHPARILGAGGFGTAFLCHDRNFEDDVVVKTLHDSAMDRAMTEVFREARLLRKLNHPAIIGVHECEYADPLKQVRPYIVMDYFPGGSLESYIQEQGALPTVDVLTLAWNIAQGMHAAHQQNVLHRDLKPDNVLVRKEGDLWQVKIIDFGLALRRQTIETSMAARSAGNTILNDSVAGTLRYAPPEQLGELKGVKPGPYSDVFAFGRMCCYALFRTTEPKRRQWAAVSDAVAELLEKCLEQELELRFPSFEPILPALETLAPARNGSRRRALSAEETPRNVRKEQQSLEHEETAQPAAELERQQQQQQKADAERHQQEQRQQEEEACQQVALATTRREWEVAENLRRWRESGQARLWVEMRRGSWTHGDWVELLATLEKSGYWPLEPAVLGEVLEQTKREWTAAQQAAVERQPREQPATERPQMMVADLSPTPLAETVPAPQADALPLLQRRHQEEETARKAEEERRRQQEEAEKHKELQRLNEAAERQRNELARQEKERAERATANLNRLKASGRLNAWVEKHLHGWDHAAWLALLKDLELAGFHPLPAAQLGELLAELRQRALEVHQQREAEKERAQQEELRRQAEQERQKQEEQQRAQLREQQQRQREALEREQREWEATKQAGTAEAVDRYVHVWPQGAHRQEALSLLPNLLRQALLNNLNDIQLRQRYLQCRTGNLREQDAQYSAIPARWRWYAVLCGGLGMLAGMALLALVGMVMGLANRNAGVWLGGLLGGAALGLLGGFVVSLITDFFDDAVVNPNAPDAIPMGIFGSLVAAPGGLLGSVIGLTAGSGRAGLAWLAAVVGGAILAWLAGTVVVSTAKDWYWDLWYEVTQRGSGGPDKRRARPWGDGIHSWWHFRILVGVLAGCLGLLQIGLLSGEVGALLGAILGALLGLATGLGTWYDERRAQLRFFSAIQSEVGPLPANAPQNRQEIFRRFLGK